MSAVTIDVHGLPSVMERITAMRQAAANMTPLYDRIGAGLLSQVQLGFKTSTSPYGQAWAALKLRNGQPLRDTGRLRSSITYKSDGDGVTVGTNLRYAAIHQFGGVILPKNKPFLMFKTRDGRFFRMKKVTIPARPFFPITDGGETVLPASYQRTVIERIQQHFALER